MSMIGTKPKHGQPILDRYIRYQLPSRAKFGLQLQYDNFFDGIGLKPLTIQTVLYDMIFWTNIFKISRLIQFGIRTNVHPYIHKVMNVKVYIDVFVIFK